MNLTEVYLEIASCIYLSIILFFYLKKKKVDTIENRIFTAVIITGVLVCFFDAVSTLVAIEYPTKLISEILIKLKLWGGILKKLLR